eukprot:m.62949 g.62949  ORF g.62949 m.62949 type:complete len:57 (+) comp13941_c1_seq1:1245-1415(+)
MRGLRRSCALRHAWPQLSHFKRSKMNSASTVCNGLLTPPATMVVFLIELTCVMRFH